MYLITKYLQNFIQENVTPKETLLNEQKSFCNTLTTNEILLNKKVRICKGKLNLSHGKIYS